MTEALRSYGYLLQQVATDAHAMVMHLRGRLYGFTQNWEYEFTETQVSQSYLCWIATVWIYEVFLM